MADSSRTESTIQSSGAELATKIATATGTPSSSTLQTSGTSSTLQSTSTASITYPSCARLCLADATHALPCAHSDSRCLCLHASSVQSSVTTCLSASGACSSADEASAALYYNNVCQQLGYLTDANSTQLLTASVATATGSPVSSSATASQTSSEATASASGSAAANTSHPDSGRLSIPAIAGIAAGIAFLIAVIITFAVFMYVQRRQPNGDKNDQFDMAGSQTRKRNDPDSDRRGGSRDKNWRSSLKRKSSLFFLEKPLPISKSTPPATATRGGPLEKELSDRPNLNNGNAPPMTLINSTDTWYNKRQAEMSTTSLMSKAHHARSPIPRTASITELSDVASIHSVTSSSYTSCNEEQQQIPHDGTGPAPSRGLSSNSLAPPPLHTRCSLVVDSQHFFSPPPTRLS